MTIPIYIIEIHTRNLPYQCEICSIGYNSRLKLNQHKRKHGHYPQANFVDSIKNFECFDCKENFQQFGDLQDHIVLHSANEQSYECKTCQARLSLFTSWRRHCLQHTKYIFDCEYCELAFCTAEKARIHIQDTHRDQADVYQCDKCTNTFPLRVLLLNHNERHQREQTKLNNREHETNMEFDKKYVCDVCQKSFVQSGSLRIHKSK